MGQSLAIKIINILFYALFAVSIVLGFIFFAVNQNQEPLLIWTYILAAVAIGGTVIFAIANIFKSKKSLISSLIVFGIFGVLLLISYSLASSADVYTALGESLNVSPGVSKWSGTGLYMLYILLGLSFVSLIFSEIRGAFK